MFGSRKGPCEELDYEKQMKFLLPANCSFSTKLQEV